MHHSKKFKKNKQNKTKKTNIQLNIPLNCPINLKPFEYEFSKTISKSLLTQSNIERKKEFARELLTKFSPNSIKPNDNFYDYINYQWLKNVSLKQQQKYIVQIDDFRLAQDKVFKQLNELILNYIKNNKNELSKNLDNYYKSVIKMNPTSYSKKLAINAIEIVDKLIQENNPWKLLAFFNSDEMLSPYAPIVWSLNPDDKNSKIFRCNLNSHQFHILDINVYYDDGTEVEYKKNYRNKFNKYVQEIFDISLENLKQKPNYFKFNSTDIFDVEKEMFDALGCYDVVKNEDDENKYNRIYSKECLSKYGFNWKEFCEFLGFNKKNIPPFFITGSLNFLKCTTDLFLAKWNTPKWKSYWVFLLLYKLMRITKDWEYVIYNFKGDFERGQERINESDSVSASLYMSIPFNTFLTEQYVSHYENPLAVKYVKTLANDLKIVFERILKRNTWLSPSTKKYALLKLKHFNFIFGKPDKLREDPVLNYCTILYDNMQLINNWRMKKFIQLEGKPVIDIPFMDWTQYPVKMSGTQAYIVNASYTPAKNSIYINLGYIQKPFVDLDERGIEYNLAHIGFTLGHEMSHSLDDWGSQYGWDGNLYDWWNKHDKKTYKKIQNDVINQYEEFAKRDGIKFDASIGIGEDLADISGMAICNEYLRDFQEKNQDLIPIRNLSFESFYTFFAFQQKQFVNRKAIRAQLKTNPHPLDKYRCNVPLSRSDIFRSLYNVKKGNGMWWKNINSVW